MTVPDSKALEYFRSRADAPRVATAMLGRPFTRAADAARALAELAADPAALRDLLAALPGPALVGLRILVDRGRPMSRNELELVCAAEVGRGKGAAAVDALATGWIGHDVYRLLVVWPPFQEPLRAILTAPATVDGPEASGPAPDRAGFLLALYLGELARRRPRVTREYRLFKRESEELHRIFGRSLGGGASLLLSALDLAGLLVDTQGPAGAPSETRLTVHPRAAELLARKPGERARILADAVELPGWLELAFRTEGKVVPREAFTRAAKRPGSTGVDLAHHVHGWLSACVVLGILEEHGGAYRLSPAVLGKGVPAPARAGRWIVQPTLELLIPPDIPPAAAFALARCCELVSVDSAAVVRLTPASLAGAAAAGLSAAEVEATVAGHALAPLPDLVVRAIREGVRASAVCRAYEGVVVTVPAPLADAARTHAAFAALVEAELAPGVFLVSSHDAGKLRKALAAAGGELRFADREGGRSSWREPRVPLAPRGATVERWLALPPYPAPDPRIEARMAAARSVEAERSLRGNEVLLEDLDLDDLDLDEDDEIEGNLEKAFKILLEDPEGASEVLPPELRAEVHEFARALGKGGPSPREVAALVAPRLRAQLETMRGEVTRGTAAPEQPPIELREPWEDVAREAISGRRDLWLQIEGERSLRSVTPHRITERAGGRELEAQLHDSGDLRAMPGARILGAAAGGPSAPTRLPGAGATPPVLRTARNGPCPCGSHRKYKACCLPGDLAAQGK